MQARRHHYLSQCYLKGFTKGGSKDSRLAVLDFERGKFFETIPAKVGAIKDFNRINIPGVDPNEIENDISKIERQVASAIKNIEAKSSLDDEDKDVILYFISLLAVRSPEMREVWRKFREDEYNITIGILLSDKKTWESVQNQRRMNGEEVNENLTFEDMKQFYERKEYGIEVSREHHLEVEFVGADAVLHCLEKRNWLLVKTNSEIGGFITTDKPVNLNWIDAGSVPAIYRSNPGYGLRGTQVHFHISKNIALIGEFEGREGIVNATKEMVALLNAKMLCSFYKQIYAPKLGFYFWGKEDGILEGTHLLKYLDK